MEIFLFDNKNLFVYKRKIKKKMAELKIKCPSSQTAG